MVDPFNCLCETTEIRRRVTASGAVSAGKQCVDCGKWRAVKKASLPCDVAHLPDFDATLSDRVHKAYAERCKEKWEEEKQAYSREWWDKYNRYLQSPQWAERRRNVIAREGGRCEACLERPAVQAHHTTYRHVGNEPLFELRAVCLECHEEITRMDRSKENAL